MDINVLNCGMKIFIYFSFLVSIAFTMNTGNDFLKDYPFGKMWEEMSTQEKINASHYKAFIRGYIRGEGKMWNISPSLDHDPIEAKIDGMTNGASA